MSLRFVRSPVAPKITSVNRSSTTDGVTSELVAERGEEAVGEGVVAARPKAGVERGGDGGRGDRLLDGVLDGPPALARVLDVRLHGLEVRVLGERVGRQLEQPRSDHAAVVPERRDAGQVEPVRRIPHELEAHSVGRQIRVLDPVVAQLYIVPGTAHFLYV